MSRCRCEASTSFRVTGEIYHYPPDPDKSGEIGSGSKMARIRCANCGGKVAYLGSDLLVTLGVPEERIQAGRMLDEDERPSLEVDLI